ncbi:hypothetical protein BOSEA31B_14590 [Hyphomicrobiales bacterium]|nr:hypothetical protein BOSEA31B_14590 [Hyphomicrobiales bacterium]CAI0344145.1 hypothetical protein BO1005MUT1_310174 [Hyphomicrobiales bacterium]
MMLPSRVPVRRHPYPIGAMGNDGMTGGVYGNSQHSYEFGTCPYKSARRPGRRAGSNAVSGRSCERRPFSAAGSGYRSGGA